MHSFYKNIVNKALIFMLLTWGSVSVYAQGTLLIKVRFDGESYSVVNVKHLAQILPKFKNKGEDNQDILFNITDDFSEVLSQGRISNPTTQHGVLTDLNTQPLIGQINPHETHTQQQGVFMLRLPHKDGMRFLHLYKETMGTARSNTGSSSKKGPMQRFDLLQYTP